MLKEKIIELCRLNKIPVNKLCIELGVSEPTMYKWFKTDSIKTKYLKSLADYFKVDMIYFLDDKKLNTVFENETREKIENVRESSGLYGKDIADLKEKYMDLLEDVYKLQKENALLREKIARYEANEGDAKQNKAG